MRSWPRLLILLAALIGGPAALRAAPLPVQAAATLAEPAPAVQQARWHDRRHWHPRHQWGRHHWHRRYHWRRHHWHRRHHRRRHIHFY